MYCCNNCPFHLIWINNVKPFHLTFKNMDLSYILLHRKSNNPSSFVVTDCYENIDVLLRNTSIESGENLTYWSLPRSIYSKDPEVKGQESEMLELYVLLLTSGDLLMDHKDIMQRYVLLHRKTPL